MSYDILLNQAVRLHETGEFDKAEQIYRQILETNPKNADILNLLGLIAQEKGIHSEAAHLFYRAIKETPSHAPLYFNLAISLEADGKPAEAAEAYEKVLKLAPDTKEAHNNLGRITKDKSHYIKALEIDPNYNEARANLAILEQDFDTLRSIKDVHSLFYLSKQLHGTEALEFALKADELLENDEIKNQLGIIYLELSHQGKAKIEFEKALKLNPRSVPALINLATLNNDETLFKKALDLSPNNINAHTNYAAFLYKQNRTTEALEEFRKAVIINPNLPEVSNNLGLILKDLGEYDEALGLFFNAFLKNPQIEEISINIFETLQVLAKKDEKSLKKAQKIAKNWQNEAKDNIFAQNIASILEGKNISPELSEKLFDHFAENFEQTLKNINYNVPQKIIEILGTVEGSVLDLGCGTGLLGKELKQTQEPCHSGAQPSEHKNTCLPAKAPAPLSCHSGARRASRVAQHPESKNQISANAEIANSNKIYLIGVDISPKMLKIAQEKQLYDELHLSNILEFIPPQPLDIVVASDVFCYFGNLEPLIEKYSKQKLCFSVETSDKTENYQLQISGRYKHNPQYVEDILKKYFTTIIKHPLILRTEDDINVEGIIFVGEP